MGAPTIFTNTVLVILISLKVIPDCLGPIYDDRLRLVLVIFIWAIWSKMTNASETVFILIIYKIKIIMVSETWVNVLLSRFTFLHHTDVRVFSCGLEDVKCQEDIISFIGFVSQCLGVLRNHKHKAIKSLFVHRYFCQSLAAK